MWVVEKPLRQSPLVGSGLAAIGTHHDRGVAQFGRAPALGAGGRRFKSCHPDYGDYLNGLALE